jgi:hypothetical protein
MQKLHVSSGGCRKLFNSGGWEGGHVFHDKKMKFYGKNAVGVK